ncbi:hypothetical protein FQN50_004726 [Emmonsiellopsis sp. PD_5]|nr:hypothetical protein FQN50_004726 [Emmonsiellopsis sp. PD_5]
MPVLSDEEYLFLLVLKLCTELGWPGIAPLYYETFPNAHKNNQPVQLYLGWRHASTKLNHFDKIRQDLKAGRQLDPDIDRQSRQFLGLVKKDDLNEIGIAFLQSPPPADSKDVPENAPQN